jgi:uracil-DNA glycosylase family 4
MNEIDPRDELDQLLAGFTNLIEWHSRAGTYGVSAVPSRRPQAAEIADEGAEAGGVPAEATARAAATESLSAVHADLGECTRCKLHATRNKIVFGVGAADAALMFVGEAPGADEDRLGEPFVGRAGQLLDKMIAAMGWTRADVYIANVLKCRPPGNRNPQADEVGACEGFLARQIDAIAPQVIVTLGKPAAHLILDTKAPISALRGRFQRYRGITVMPTFHPAYLLRSPERKRETWEDLKKVMDELERLGVESPHPAKR